MIKIVEASDGQQRKIKIVRAVDQQIDDEYMLKKIYDKDADGVVDEAENIDGGTF